MKKRSKKYTEAVSKIEKGKVYTKEVKANLIDDLYKSIQSIEEYINKLDEHIESYNKKLHKKDSSEELKLVGDELRKILEESLDKTLRYDTMYGILQEYISTKYKQETVLALDPFEGVIYQQLTKSEIERIKKGEYSREEMQELQRKLIICVREFKK